MYDHILYVFQNYFFIEGMHLYPRRTGWSPDRKCLLGIVLFGTRYPA
jgi:hypothetical protein